MDILAWVCAAAIYGFAMFLWGTLSERKLHTVRVHDEWVHGFRDGWEAAEQFDTDIRMIWGDLR